MGINECPQCGKPIVVITAEDNSPIDIVKRKIKCPFDENGETECYDGKGDHCVDCPIYRL